MEVGRARVVLAVDEGLERALLLGRAAQLQQHVLDREIVGEGAAVVRRRGFGAQPPCRTTRLDSSMRSVISARGGGSCATAAPATMVPTMKASAADRIPVI